MIGGSGQGGDRPPHVGGRPCWPGLLRYAVTISRGNNDANVLVLGANLSTDADVEELLELWLATPFKGGVHAERLAQIGRLEAGR
nr:RpiB/LacA/LacB family sugar-phosphate isomerase [Aeromicrobium sp.]